MIAFNSVTSSIGNVASENNDEKSYLLFKSINVISIIFYGACAITIYNMINSFIEIWIGNAYILEIPVVLLLSVNFYVFGSQNTLGSYRNAHGLFWEGRYRPIIMTVLNLAFSILLVNVYGLAGVFCATIISRLLSVGIIDSFIIYRNIFNKKVYEYHKMKFKHSVIVLLVALLISYISNLIYIDNFFYWILKSIFIAGFSIIILVLLFWRSEELEYLKKLVLPLLKR